MDAQRALLDQLMGKNRDGDKPDQEISDFRDRRVCKKYLCGLCPHDLFQNTKMDLGECDKAHLPKLKHEYDQARLTRDFGYETDLERELSRFVADVDKKIQRAQRRLEEKDGKNPLAAFTTNVEDNKEVLEITAEIQETMQKAEEAGNEGDVDLSMELMEKVEELKKKKASAQASAMIAASSNPEEAAKRPVPDEDMSMDLLSNNPLASANVNQKLRVCDVCGAFLSIFDSDRRLADHFGGKLHLGYLQIQKKLEEFKKLRERDSERESQSKEKENGTANDSASKANDDTKERERRRDRSRDRDRRNRSRSRDRYRPYRSRDSRNRRHRSPSHSRSRSRDRDRDRHRRDRRRH